MSQTSGQSAGHVAPDSDADAQITESDNTVAANETSVRVDDASITPGFLLEEESLDALSARIGQLERRSRIQLFAIVAIVMLSVGVFLKNQFVDNIIVRQKLMESKELTLLDNDGNARLFLRMFSKVPVLQIMDSNGRPRMSLGLRFDDSPFVDLSDKSGRTRATFEITEEDEPALRMFDENGTPTFNIN